MVPAPPLARACCLCPWIRSTGRQITHQQLKALSLTTLCQVGAARRPTRSTPCAPLIAHLGLLGMHSIVHGGIAPCPNFKAPPECCYLFEPMIARRSLTCMRFDVTMQLQFRMHYPAAVSQAHIASIDRASLTF